MSVQMKLGRWRARDGSVHLVVSVDREKYWPWRGEDQIKCWDDNGRQASTDPRFNHKDLVEYLGPLSPTPASAEAGPACDSVKSAKDTLAMMRHEYKALDRWLSAYKALVAENERAKSDLEEAIKRLEKEVEG